MLPKVKSYIKRIDERINEMDLIEANCSDQVRYILATHIVLAGSGMVEVGVQSTLSEYGRINGDSRIAEFIEKKVKEEYALDWGKIRKMLEQFDRTWCDKIRQKTEEKNIEAVTSLKTHRNRIAHGRDAVIGYGDAKKYYSRAKCFLRDFEEVILI